MDAKAKLEQVLGKHFSREDAKELTDAIASVAQIDAEVEVAEAELHDHDKD